ncbi:MAG: hypothetical protein IPN15_16950 [Saprospiraceae bacterium]|nr:hypothetical protein [Candidatus Vicinibacter affinis]
MQPVALQELLLVLPTPVALAASIASIIAGVSNAFGSIPGYKTGTEYIQGPGTKQVIVF